MKFLSAEKISEIEKKHVAGNAAGWTGFWICEICGAVVEDDNLGHSPCYNHEHTACADCWSKLNKSEKSKICSDPEIIGELK